MKKKELLREIELLKNSLNEQKDLVQHERKRSIEFRNKILDNKITLVNEILKSVGETNHEIRFKAASTVGCFSGYQTHIFTLILR